MNYEGWLGKLDCNAFAWICIRDNCLHRIAGRHNKYVIAKQLLWAGTCIGANIREIQNAERKLDFIHKMKIVAKEADETDYWLILCKMS